MSAQEPSMADFSEMIDAQLAGYRHGFNPGERVTGTIVELGESFVVLDIHAKREGIILRQELLGEDGEPTVAVGEAFDAYFVGVRDGAFLLSTRMTGAAAGTSVRAAAESGLPLEGLVKSECNGGYEITVAGQRAFCPFSQIALYKEEGAEYTGKRLSFIVTEYGEEGRNIVVSHRVLLEREREAEKQQLMETLKEGDLREGRVTKLMEFGVFVDIGGAEGLIPLRELSWDRDAKPEDVVKAGDSVGVVVQSIDWERDRISLSLRYAAGNPWDLAPEKYLIGGRHEVKVTKLMAFGAFAELEPGIEGLIHISKLGGGRRIHHAREAVAEGDLVEVQIETVDLDARRIGLSPVDERVDRLSAANDALAVGSRIKGIVEGVRDFGVFVKLSGDVTGLLHVSETDVPRRGNMEAQLERAYPPGEEVAVVVKAIDGSRIGLTTPEKFGQVREDPEADARQYLSKQKSAESLGSLGDT